jgi:hypothetical protein
MTTTIGQQLAPYVEEKPKEKEATPCETISWDWRMPKAPYGISLPEGKIPHPEGHNAGLCPNEATWEGVCPLGDTSANVCDECHTRLVLGETAGILQSRSGRPSGRFTMIPRDCTILGTGYPGAHPPHHEWMWFKK